MLILLVIPIVFAIMLGVFVYDEIIDEKDERERKRLKRLNEEEEEEERVDIFKHFESLTDEQLRATKRRLRAVSVSYNGFADNIREIYIANIDTILNLRSIEKTRKEILKYK